MLARHYYGSIHLPRERLNAYVTLSTARAYRFQPTAPMYLWLSSVAWVMGLWIAVGGRLLSHAGQLL